jgi:hypothetical protein
MCPKITQKKSFKLSLTHKHFFGKILSTRDLLQYKRANKEAVVWFLNIFLIEYRLNRYFKLCFDEIIMKRK